MLTALGLFSIAWMVACYELEHVHPRFIFGFAIGCIASGVYALLQGAWPFLIAEIVFAMSAVKRWNKVMGR